MKPAFFLPLALGLLVSCSPGSQPAGYVLQFGSDFDVGRNFVDDLGISVVVAVDVSGSMIDAPQSGGEPKYVQASQALATVTAYLGALTQTQPDLKIQLAILKFSGRVETLLPLTIVDQATLDRLRVLSRPENFLPDGGTAIGKAVEAGARILAQSGTILNSLIVVTDGENTDAPSPVEAIQAVYANRNSASTSEVTVTTSTQLLSFIGFDIDSPQFQTFHDLGGRVTSAANQAELESSLKNLLEADITKLEGN